MILVTGATGTVGRLLVDGLRGEGAAVRALSRNPERAGLPDGVEVRRGELGDTAAVRDALDGVDRVFLFPAPGAGHPFLDAATGSGVRRVVLLSAAAVEIPEAGLIATEHAAYERAVTASGLDWTILRPGQFMANDRAWAAGVRSAGVVRAPFPDAVSVPVHERDIAAVAVRALLDDGRNGDTYELSGPEPLTTGDRVRLLAAALGRPVRYEEVPAQRAREQLLRAGTPAAMADSVLGLQDALRHRPAVVSPHVGEVTGRAPFGYRDWLRHHLSVFDDITGASDEQ